jgi:TonB-linked SusC/RagA family outer membrane protein
MKDKYCFKSLKTQTCHLMKLFHCFFRKSALLLIGIMASSFMFGQTVVKGTVTSAEDKSPVSGANVVLKGGSRGVLTDINGKYSISVNSTSDVLVFSFVGFITEEIPVGNQTEINVIMVPDIQNLESIVVMGYSTKKKSEITSAVATVSSDKLLDATSSDLGSLLQGKVSGIQVINSSGEPGASSEIRIRGISSFSAPQEPLYVVDGIIGGSFDPNDVETVTVLKDAGATGMYGSMANGGVIIITTKRAKSEKPQFEFKVVTGYRVAEQGHVSMMDSKTLYNYQREFFRDPVKFVIDDRKFKQARPDSLLKTNTNWLAEAFKPALIQNYYLSSSGRSGKLSYYIGASYYNEEGTFINTNYQKINLRANTDYKFSEAVTLSNNINIAGSKNRGYDYMNLYYSYTSMPWDNPYDAKGNPRSFKTADGIWSKDKINPIYAADNSELSSKGFSLDYDMSLNVKILPWLSFSSTNRVSAYSNMNYAFYSKNCDNLSYYGSGYVGNTSNFEYGGISTNLLKFNFDMGQNSITGLLGFEGQADNFDYVSASGMGMPEGLRVASVASKNFLIGGVPSRTVMQSFISQLNYNHANKYFLSASFRVDESSLFAPNKRKAMFPSVSGAWLLSNEDFLKAVTAIHNLKVKLSWGNTGMKDIGADKYIEKFVYSSQYDQNPAAIPSQMPNYDLTWEQTGQFNAGLEIGLWKRLDIEVDFYNNLTKDLLVNRALAPSGGFSNQWQNIGKDLNRGVEVSFTTTNIKSADFLWTTDFSIGFNKNQLSSFGKDTIINVNSYGVMQVYHSGAPLYSWYAKEYYGIDPADGSMLWVGKDGKTTHNYQDARLVEDGTPMPKFQGGFATMLKYKGLSLRGNFAYVYGNKIYNYFRRYVDHDLMETQFNVMMPRDDYKLWQQPGDIATKPLPQNARNSFDPSTRFIEDGSFLKIRNITLTYEFPRSVTSALKLSGLSLSLSADNVYTFTNFWGQDPEVSISDQNGNLPGYAEFKYPNNRQYLVSVKIQF